MSDWVAAVFGLVGTGVGSATTLVPQWIKDRRERAASTANARREAQVTALLLVDDLDLARRRLRGAYRKDHLRFWSEEFALPLASWVDGRPQIAHHLSRDVWETVAPAFRELAEIEKAAAAARDGDPKARPALSTGDQAWLRRVVEEVVHPAVTALAAFAGAPAPLESADVSTEPTADRRG